MQKKDGRLKKWIRESFFIFIVTTVSDFIYNSIGKSLIGGFFSSYDSAEKMAKGGFLAGIFDKIKLGKRVINPIKNNLRASIDKSFILNLIKEKIYHLICYPVKVYGIFLLSFGLYTSIAFMIGRFALNRGIAFSTLIFGIAAMAAALPMLFSEKTLACVISESAAVNLILFKGLGIKRSIFEKEEKRYGRIYVAFLLGMFLGILSYLVSPLYITAAIILVLGVYMLLTVPESGVVLLLFSVPFLPTMALAGLIVLISISYFFKLIRGKRTLKIEAVDIFVIIFAAFVLSGGLFSISTAVSIKPAALYVCFILGYFLVVNLIRTREFASRAITAVITSSLFVSAYGIFEYFTGIASTIWQDEEMFGDIGGRVVSTFGNPNVLAEYLLMVTLVAFAGAISIKTTTAKRLFMLFASGLCGVCLILTWSRGAWLGFIFGALVFLLIYSKRSMILILLGVCAVPFLPFVLPSSIINRFTSIGNMADSSTAYRLHIWEASAKMAGDFALSGIGSGNGTFAIAYPQYSLAGIESAPHSHSLYLQVMIEIGIFGLCALLAVILIFAISQFSFNRDCLSGIITDNSSRVVSAAGFAGIAAVLVQGMTDYIWYNYRIFLMFWLIIGLVTAVKRTARIENLKNEADMGDHIDIPIGKQ